MVKKKKRDSVAQLPVDMILLSLATEYDENGVPLKLNDFKKMDPEIRGYRIRNMLNCTGEAAVTGASAIVHDYLNFTASDYINDVDKKEEQYKIERSRTNIKIIS